MKGPLTLLFALVLPISAMSQKMGKFFYNKQWELTTRDSATYIRMCVYDTLNHFFAGPITDMFLSGKPQMKGTYKLMKKDGDFTFFYENGVVESRGRFQNDTRVGPWIFNHPNGKLKMEGMFEMWGSTKILSLYDESGVPMIKDGTGKWYEEYEEPNVPGKVIVTGEFRKYFKHGEWTCKLSNGQMRYTEKYDNGEFVGGFSYIDGVKTESKIPNGNQLVVPYKLMVTERFASTGDVDFKTYPLLDVMRRGDEVFFNPKSNAAADSVWRASVDMFTIVEESAFPPKGMSEFYKFIANEMKYPAAARRAGIQGKVFVQFVIEKDGSITDVEVFESPNPSLNEEAIRVVVAYAARHKWYPGMQRGKAVKQRMVMPITFKLG